MQYEYRTEGMIDPHNYDLAGAQTVAKEYVRYCAPNTVQDLLNLMVFHGFEQDDLNRRAVLYLLADDHIRIDREKRRIVIGEAK